MIDVSLLHDYFINPPDILEKNVGHSVATIFEVIAILEMTEASNIVVFCNNHSQCRELQNMMINIIMDHGLPFNVYSDNTIHSFTNKVFIEPISNRIQYENNSNTFIIYDNSVLGG